MVYCKIGTWCKLVLLIAISVGLIWTTEIIFLTFVFNNGVGCSKRRSSKDDDQSVEVKNGNILPFIA